MNIEWPGINDEPIDLGSINTTNVNAEEYLFKFIKYEEFNKINIGIIVPKQIQIELALWNSWNIFGDNFKDPKKKTFDTNKYSMIHHNLKDFAYGNPNIRIEYAIKGQTFSNKNDWEKEVNRVLFNKDFIELL